LGGEIFRTCPDLLWGPPSLLCNEYRVFPGGKAAGGDELDKLIRYKNTINYIKAQRLSWFDHLQRMPEERMVKKSIQVETDVKKTTRETKEQMGR
jgi:hypothetical protein